jgi:hypothetical protein
LNRWKNYSVTECAYVWAISTWSQSSWSWKSINRLVVIKFLQNYFRQEAKCYCLLSTNSLILLSIKKNCLISGRSLLLYQFTERVTKLTVRIITAINIIQNIIEYPPLKVKSLCRRNYWESSLWVPT